MRILICADIEGASGVTSRREIGYPRKPLADAESNPDYLTARRWLTADINAAVEGAMEAGASSFVVHDSHGLDYRNVDLSELHPAVEVVRGMPIMFYEHADLDNSFDAAFLIGMHSRPGQPGILSHALSWPLLQEIRINGKPVGESEITLELAGYFEIPTVLTSGDDMVTDEVMVWTGGNIQTAVVKYSLSRYAARCLPLEESHERIKNAAKLAVGKINKVKLGYVSSPYTLEIDFLDRQVALYASYMPLVEYDGDTTASYTSSDFLDIYKTLLAMYWIGTSTFNP